MLLAEGVGSKELIVKKIIFAVDMQESMIADTKPRADILFWTGFVLLVLSLVFPIIATFLYYGTEPISHQTIEQIANLKKEIGELPKEFSVPLSRDWHVLLGGITFGFLCLAAARGILAQQSNEMKTFVELGERARYFERLNSVAQIILKVSNRNNESEKRAVEFLKERLLLESSQIGEVDSNKLEDEATLTKLTSEILKAIHSFKST